MTSSWACVSCTYLHESEKEQGFLRCAICSEKRTTITNSIGSASSQQAEPPTKSAATSTQKPHYQKRQGNLLHHFGRDQRKDTKRHCTSTTGNSIKRSTQLLESKHAPSESIPAPKTPTRSILDALKPQKASSFVPPVRYRDGPKEDWRIIASDDEINKLCPMTLVRDVLPPDIASRLLHQLEGESSNWNRGKWIVFGKEHNIRRLTATYSLAATTTANNQQLLDATGRERLDRVKDNNYDDAGDDRENTIHDDEDDEYMDQDRDISSELREAARCVSEQVQRHCPWAAGNQNQVWEPTFAFANRYADGQDSVGWHSDHITPLGPRPIIVGLTLGACRRFDLRQQVDGKRAGSSKCRHVAIPLPHNSLCIMWNDAQESWQHSVPPTSDDVMMKHSKVGTVRISLTFRKQRSIPDQGNCHCGRPAGLRAKDGRYYLFCRPYGKDKAKTCFFWKPCEWAEVEAKRLETLEISSAREKSNDGLGPVASRV